MQLNFNPDHVGLFYIKKAERCRRQITMDFFWSQLRIYQRACKSQSSETPLWLLNLRPIYFGAFSYERKSCNVQCTHGIESNLWLQK